MNPSQLYRRYQELQSYVGWHAADAVRIQSIAKLVEPNLPALVDDFYAEIERHPGAQKVITGGEEQVRRLKGTLIKWLQELLAGPYDDAYVARRWKVGWRHVEIGLDQVYTNVALARLRKGLLRTLAERWPGNEQELAGAQNSLNALLDLDLAIIEDAYQAEHVAREQQAERLRGSLARMAEREQLMSAKARTEAAFRSLIEAAPCMIVMLRFDAKVVYFSPFAEELTGYPAMEVVGKDFFSVFIPKDDDRDAMKSNMDAIEAGTATRGFENSVVCRDGSRRWIVWNAERLSAYEEAPAVLMVGQDITTLKKAQEQALQSARLAAIGQMMTVLAHESGNALARSQTCLEMLGLELEDRPEALEYVGRIQKAQDHLRLLYEEVRDYAAPLKLDFTEWNLAQIWRQAWENLSVLRQGKSAVLSEEIDGQDLMCAADPFRLGQVFRNILENSLAAAPSHAEVKVTCSTAEIDGSPAITIAFSDNGPGLSAEQTQRIFEPFFTTKTKGTGLGMAIAKRIVEAHGGCIEVGEAASGLGGAEIRVTVPKRTS